MTEATFTIEGECDLRDLEDIKQLVEDLTGYAKVHVATMSVKKETVIDLKG